MAAPEGPPCCAVDVHESIVKFARLGVIPLASVNVGSHVTATVNGELSVQRLIVTSDTTPHRGAAASQSKRCAFHVQSSNRICVARPLLLFGSRSTPLRQLRPKLQLLNVMSSPVVIDTDWRWTIPDVKFPTLW
jgi:hypothetical protein